MPAAASRVPNVPQVVKPDGAYAARLAASACDRQRDRPSDSSPPHPERHKSARATSWASSRFAVGRSASRWVLGGAPHAMGMLRAYRNGLWIAYVSSGRTWRARKAGRRYALGLAQRLRGSAAYDRNPRLKRARRARRMRRGPRRDAVGAGRPGATGPVDLLRAERLNEMRQAHVRPVFDDFVAPDDADKGPRSPSA